MVGGVGFIRYPCVCVKGVYCSDRFLKSFRDYFANVCYSDVAKISLRAGTDFRGIPPTLSGSLCAGTDFRGIPPTLSGSLCAGTDFKGIPLDPSVLL